MTPSLAFDYAQAHACLNRLGHPDRAFDHLVKQSVRSQAFTGRERPPHRVLEQLWVAKLLGISAPRSYRSAAANSVLGHPMDLLSSSREDIYALTHALMFFTDFDAPVGRLPRSRTTILAEAEALLACCLDEDDFDLGGEVLLAWPLSNGDWTSGAAFGFRVLCRVEDTAGFLPSSGTRMTRLETLKGEERTNYLLASAYHTAYVMGLICAASLQPGKAPPASIPTKKMRQGASERVLKFLGSESRSRHWFTHLQKLTDSERDALAQFIFAIALRRRVCDRNFGGMRELLRVGYELGLTSSPAASQAAEMLERLAVLVESNAPLSGGI